MRIAELAARVGVPTSTVRYYERVGLLASPARTTSGYRDYDDEAVARLLFISRARRMGVSCEQITGLLPIWHGTNCGAAQLDLVRLELEANPPSATCRADLSCCMPETNGVGPIAVELQPKYTPAPR